jgi:hypothetical protein
MADFDPNTRAAGYRVVKGVEEQEQASQPSGAAHAPKLNQAVWWGLRSRLPLLHAIEPHSHLLTFGATRFYHKSCLGLLTDDLHETAFQGVLYCASQALMDIREG